MNLLSTDDENEITNYDYALVKVFSEGNKIFRYFICKILEKQKGFIGQFLKEKNQTKKFIMTDETTFIPQSDVTRHIPNRYVLTSSSSRFFGALSFYDDELDYYTIH